MGLSPFGDRVHKCGQTRGTEAVSVCTDSVGYHSCHSAGTCPPPLPTLPLESAATRPPPLFPHNVSIVTCQVVAGRQGWGTPACWGKEDAGGIHSPSSTSKGLGFVLSALPDVSSLRATGLDAHRENPLPQPPLHYLPDEMKAQTQLTGGSEQ